MTFNENVEKEAWQRLQDATVNYNGKPVGTIAAADPNPETINYNQVFIRDFVISAMVFLMKGQSDIVRHFLQQTVYLQSTEKQMDCFKPGRGLMPASFRVETMKDKEKLVADFGQNAIARVAPVDSGFWWLYILRAYTRATGDDALAKSEKFQKCIRLILDLYLTASFEMFPTLLVPDGSFMIDRRMGVYGHPLDVQSLFFTALRSAKELLVPREKKDIYVWAVNERLGHLLYHIRTYYWMNREILDQLNGYHVEEYGENAINKFNIYPATVPEWLVNWLPEAGGFFIGNLGPGRMDYRFFSQGNLMSLVNDLADKEQCRGLMDLIGKHSDDLIGRMPLKICYPALQGQDWKTLTGSDPKNTPWSYHNGGHWPFLLWNLAAAAIKTDRIHLAENAVSLAAQRLVRDQWPEYYDGLDGSAIGKKARRYQTWTAAGYLAAIELLRQPEHLKILSFDKKPDVQSCSSRKSAKQFFHET